MTVYGYARVSTNGQTLASQDAQLHAAGCAKVYSEKISGVRSDRPELAKLLRRLNPGDVLMVTRLDRLARSTRDLLNILDTIAKAEAGFKSVADAWADTTTPHGRLMLTILGGLAEFERELIRARTGEGRTRAKARGVRFGRPPSLTVHQRQEVIQRLAEGIAQADLARTYGVSQATISRMQPSPFGGASVGASHFPHELLHRRPDFSPTRGNFATTTWGAVRQVYARLRCNLAQPRLNVRALRERSSPPLSHVMAITVFIMDS